MNSKINNFYIITLMTAILFVSCSKDRSEHDSQSISSINKTTQKLLDFKQNLLIKSGSGMLSDSAEWHLEGLLNYEKANNLHDFNQVEFLYDTLIWPSFNGVVSYEDLQQIYNSVIDIAQSMTLNNGSENYTFDVIDLHVIETGLKNGEQSVVVGISGGVPGTIQTYLPFDNTDYWESGGLQGKCDIYAGQFMGRDATTELEQHFKGQLYIPSYFVSIVTTEAHAIDNETDDNPYGPYMMWAENSNHSNNCLSPEELNYYLSKWDYIKNNYQPDGKTFCSVDVRWNVIVARYSNEFHTYILKYGVNIGSNPN